MSTQTFENNAIIDKLKEGSNNGRGPGRRPMSQTECPDIREIPSQAWNHLPWYVILLGCSKAKQK